MTNEEYEAHVARCNASNVCPMCERPAEEHDFTEPNESWPNGTMRCRKVAVNTVSENYYAEMNDKTELPIVAITTGPSQDFSHLLKESATESSEVLTPEITREALEKLKRDQAVAAATVEFEKAFRDRPFSQRHTELGKMIKCAECGKRHRASVRHDFKIIKEANPKRFREPANPYWRPKPGRFAFIQSLKKFVSLKS